MTPTPRHPSMDTGTRGGISHSPALSHPQVARLSVAEAPTSPTPKGDSLGRGPDTRQLWGSPAAQGSPGDKGKGGGCPIARSTQWHQWQPPVLEKRSPPEDAAPCRQTWFTETPRPLWSQG